MQPVDDLIYHEAKAKLRWSAEGEWSTSLTPEMCGVLLRKLEELEGMKELRAKLGSDVVGPLARLSRYPIYEGDPGDETDAA